MVHFVKLTTCDKSVAFFQIDCDVLLLDEVLNFIFVGVFSKIYNIKLIIPAILVKFLPERFGIYLYRNVKRWDGICLLSQNISGWMQTCMSRLKY